MNVLFFDLDGTLMFDHTIAPACVDALQRVQKAGHKLILNTGRSIGIIPPVVTETIRWDGMICGGTYIVLNGELLHRQIMSREALLAIWDYCHKFGLRTHLEAEGGLLVIDESQPGTVTRKDIEENSDDLRVTKGTVFHVIPPEEFPHFPGMQIIGMPRYLEVLVEGWTKSTGMGIIGEKLGIGREDMIAFGDSPNDLDMIRYAGTGVIMAGAPAELEPYAAFRTVHPTEGVAEAIRKLFPELF